ncbi:MAG TPA: ribonuclease E, partial [Nitrosospira sp.]
MKKKKSGRMRSVVRVIVNGGLLTACISYGTATHAAVNIQFEYMDAPGTGFLDPVNGPSWQAAMNTAATRFSSMFGSHFSNTGTIVLKATSSNDAASSTLASAASEFVDPGRPGFNLGEVVRTKLQTGVDLNDDAADGSVDVNFGHSWELDYNATPSGSKYDFYSTLFHEFTHTLGFISSIGENGDPVYGTWDSGSWNRFDSFIVD